MGVGSGSCAAGRLYGACKLNRQGELDWAYQALVAQAGAVSIWRVGTPPCCYGESARWGLCPGRCRGRLMALQATACGVVRRGSCLMPLYEAQHVAGALAACSLSDGCSTWSMISWHLGRREMGEARCRPPVAGKGGKKRQHHRGNPALAWRRSTRQSGLYAGNATVSRGMRPCGAWRSSLVVGQSLRTLRCSCIGAGAIDQRGFPVLRACASCLHARGLGAELLICSSRAGVAFGVREPDREAACRDSQVWPLAVGLCFYAGKYA